VGKLITNERETPSILFDIAVYQGDPLSVVIFNTIINILVDTLQSRIDLGYMYPCPVPSSVLARNLFMGGA